MGDLIFVLTGSTFPGFATLVRYWRVSAFSVATVISVLSPSRFRLYVAIGRARPRGDIGLGENALQALGARHFGRAAAMYLFTVSIQRLGVARAAIFPATVPALTLLLGRLLIGEPPTALQAAGLVTALAGFDSRSGNASRATIPK